MTDEKKTLTMHIARAFEIVLKLAEDSVYDPQYFKGEKDINETIKNQRDAIALVRRHFELAQSKHPSNPEMDWTPGIIPNAIFHCQTCGWVGAHPIENRASEYCPECDGAAVDKYIHSDNAHFDSNLMAEIAAVAPQQPEWFVYEPALPVPKMPDMAFKYPEYQNLVDNWRHDPIYDLGETDSYGDKLKTALREYRQKWEEYWSRRNNYHRSTKKYRYFAWRIFFARELLKALV